MPELTYELNVGITGRTPFPHNFYTFLSLVSKQFLKHLVIQ